jgi:hypothetical protein
MRFFFDDRRRLRGKLLAWNNWSESEDTGGDLGD